MAERIADVAVVVEDEPPRRAVERHGLDGVLPGRYSGTPLTWRRVRGRSSIARMPDVIRLYQGPNARATGGDEARIAQLANATLRREIGRSFGPSPEPDSEVDEV